MGTHNHKAIITAVVLNMLLGYVWYSPQIFGQIWLNALNVPPEKLNPGDSLPPTQPTDHPSHSENDDGQSPAGGGPPRPGRPSASRVVVSVMPWVTWTSQAGRDPGARQQQAGAGPAHQGQQGLLDGHACDVGDHVESPSVADA